MSRQSTTKGGDNGSARTVHLMGERELVARGGDRIALDERTGDLETVVALLARELLALDVAEFTTHRDTTRHCR